MERSAIRGSAPHYAPLHAGYEGLRVELEQDHVAVLDDIIFAFVARLPGLFGRLLAAKPDVIVEGDRLRADKAAPEIGVDDSGGLRRARAPRHRPGARLLGADREEGHE